MGDDDRVGGGCTEPYVSPLHVTYCESSQSSVTDDVITPPCAPIAHNLAPLVKDGNELAHDECGQFSMVQRGSFLTDELFLTADVYNNTHIQEGIYIYYE